MTDTRQTVMIMTEDRPTVGTVSTALSRDPRFNIGGVCASADELLVRLQQESPAVAVVDVDPQPAESLRRIEAAIARFPRTRFVLIGREAPMELVLAAMEAGARHFLTKDRITSSLAEVLQRVAPPANEGARSGPVVTILSAGGGCGCTLLALNLSHELQELLHQDVVLVDLDLHYRPLALLLGLQVQYGVADLLADSERIDREMVRTAAASYGDRLRVLTSPAGGFPDPNWTWDTGAVYRLLAGCRSAASFVVVDAPRVPMNVAAALAAESAATLVTFRLAVKDVQVARSMIRELQARGIDPQRLRAVVGRYSRRDTMVPVPDAARVLDPFAPILLRDDVRGVHRSMDRGQPLARAAPRGDLRRDILGLARGLLRSAGGREAAA